MSQHNRDAAGGTIGQRPRSVAWRKETIAPTTETHTWQTEGGNGLLRLLAAARRSVATGILLLSFVGLTALLVYELLLLPVKTTLIAAIAEDYHWPLPPAGWASEDLAALKTSLGGQTLSVRELPLAGVSSGKALADFASQFDRAARTTQRGGTVVVYVSAHGVVDGEGRPCLLLPNGDPYDSRSWLQVSDLLAEVKSTRRQGGIHWLLILDANRQSENWSIGLLQNTFAEGLAKAVVDAGVPGLAVLNSSSPGEIGWSSLHFRNTVFGHFLQLGMAGAADANGDGRVSLHELTAYLKKNVDDWTCTHRAAHQTPALYPDAAADYPITWSLNARDLAQLAAPMPRHSVADEAAAGGKLAPLWIARERLETHHPDHYAPAKWQELAHNLLWLEQAATSGAAYRDTFGLSLRRIQGELESAAQIVQQLPRTGQGGPPPIKLAAALSADATLPLQDLNVYSRPLAEYTGTANANQAEKFSDTQLGSLFQRYGVAQLWTSTDIPRRATALHQLGEQLAVPQADGKLAADDRAHAVVRPLLDSADQARRETEDAVFLGPPGTMYPWSAADLIARMDRAQQQYREVAAVETALAQAYQLRDRAWAELPYLAQWAERQDESNAARVTPAGKPPAEAPNLMGKVSGLIEAAQRLDRALRRAEQEAQRGGKLDSLTAISNSASGTAREVADSLEQFHKQLNEAARRLPLAASTPAALLEISNLLTVPMISGRLRSDLYARYVETAEDIDSDTAAGLSSAKEGKPVELPRPTTGNRWTLHPAAALLRSADSPAPQEAAASLSSLGEELRSALGKLAASPPAAEADNSAARNPKAETALSAAGFDLLDADRPLRRLVALREASSPDPFRRIQRRHLQDLLLWHGRRALDDFWGTTQSGGQQYFAEVAEAYITDARQLAHADAQVERTIQGLGSLLVRRSEAASSGLATTSTDLVLVDEDVAATARVGLQRTPAAAGLPKGIAAVYLRDDNTTLPQTLRPFEIGPTADGRESQQIVTISVPGRDLANRTATMQAVAMFRGHEFPAPVMRRDVGGPRVEIQRQPGGPSHITMRGARPKRASIVFILDCSHSMADPVRVEAPDVSSRGAQMTKMNIAIDALQGMMERLGEQGDVRVGVRFFGHRVGWRTDQVGVVARQESYPGGVPPALRPYEDIELFLPLGRFDSITAGNVNRRLRTLKPWGESPIFLSLMETLKDFSAEDEKTERRVVVITDGMNYQFNPPPEAAPSLNDVENAYSSHGIGVDIVGFGIPEEERSTAVRDFTRLAQTTQGSFTLATNASSLVRRLDQLLIKPRFRVLDDAGRLVGETDLGGTIAVNSQAAPPQSCTIEVEQLRARTVLRGAESLQLAVSHDGRRIISLAYEEDSPVFIPLVTPQPTGPSGYHVGLHRRVRETDSVVFPISFQRDDQGIPLPPSQVWIEITPVSQGRRMVSNCYVFYDASYEPDMPVPLIRCRCQTWPADANQAEVRVWCTEEAMRPAEVVPLAKVSDQAPLSGEGFVLTTITGVHYQVRNLDRDKALQRRQIRVVERHKPEVPANAVKVEISGPPSRITHQFDWDHGVVLHSFEYDPSTTRDGPPAELRFFSRDQFTAGAWRMEQPAILDIARHVEVVLPPRLIGPSLTPANPAGL